MNAFQKHGIAHLSPSSLALWRSAPGIFALRYLAKIRDDGNAAMWRGTAVEAGFAALLSRVPLEVATEVAHQSFDLNAAGEISDEIEGERENIGPMLGQCQIWTAPGDMIARQLKVEHWFDDIPVPIIGYLDFAFENIDVDLKTTKACPSVPRSDHVRQVSLYRAARGRLGALLYVTGKRHAYFDVDDRMMADALNDLQSDALSLYQFLGRVHTTKDALACLPMDRENFRYPKLKVPFKDLLAAG